MQSGRGALLRRAGVRVDVQSQVTTDEGRAGQVLTHGRADPPFTRTLAVSKPLGRGTTALPHLSLRGCPNKNAIARTRESQRTKNPYTNDPRCVTHTNKPQRHGCHKKSAPLEALPGYLDTRPGETIPEVIPGKQNVSEKSR